MLQKRLALLLLLVLLPLAAVVAQDAENQPLIIAQRQNKLYAVSPVDGTATVIVEPDMGQELTGLRNNDISPDQKWLAYVTTERNANNQYISHLFMMNLVDGTVEMIESKGGVFDRPLPATRFITMNTPTWSYDGTRLYYVRIEVDTQRTATIVDGQLAYYDRVEHTHHLVGRFEPGKLLEGIWAVKSGIVIRTFQPDSDVAEVTLYAQDNAIIKQVQVVNALPNPVTYEGQTHYAGLATTGAITQLTNAETGAAHDLPGIYYPADYSLQAGADALRIFRYFGEDGTWFHVYGADAARIKELRDQQGFLYALAPDGQSLAYVQYEGSGFGTIRIMDKDGAVRDLPFEAEIIVWGKMEAQAFMP